MSILAHCILRAAALAVPKAQRSEWLREWTAELVCFRRERPAQSATAFCLGAFRDAFCMRSLTERPAFWRELLRGASPASCLALLAVQAVVAALVMWASPAVRAVVWDRSVEAHALIAAGAILLSPIAPGAQRLRVGSVRGWCFMAAKLAILTVTVYFTSFDIVPVISRAPVQPQLAFVLYILAYRWAMNDQRRRCPVCLRLLTNPVQIGHSAGTLLEWYGAELVCPRGHGVLHEPELLASSYCVPRWVNMDASWRELFSEPRA